MEWLITLILIGLFLMLLPYIIGWSLGVLIFCGLIVRGMVRLLLNRGSP